MLQHGWTSKTIISVKEASFLHSMMPFISEISRKGKSIETENRTVVAWRRVQKFTTSNPKETLQGDGNVLKLYYGKAGRTQQMY